MGTSSITIGMGSLALIGAYSSYQVQVVGGPYSIAVSGATGGTFNPANYSITYTPGRLTVGFPVGPILAALGGSTRIVQAPGAHSPHPISPRGITRGTITSETLGWFMPDLAQPRRGGTYPGNFPVPP